VGVFLFIIECVTIWLRIFALMRRDVFQAIADPTRRDIIALLAGGAMNLNTLAGHFPVSRPAISKHIRILTECGLVTVQAEGRERHCHAELHALREVAQWAEQYRVFWAGKLHALDKFLQQENQSSKTSKRKL
jgi:DNA-binding transcriptional ArsR family regulator